MSIQHGIDGDVSALLAVSAPCSFIAALQLAALNPDHHTFLHFTSPTTHRSPYGEGTMVLLRSLARERGFHARAYAALHYETFGEGFEGYRNASTTVSVFVVVCCGFDGLVLK